MGLNGNGFTCKSHHIALNLQHTTSQTQKQKCMEKMKTTKTSILGSDSKGVICPTLRRVKQLLRGTNMKRNTTILYFLLLIGIISGCTEKGRRNSLRPLSEGSFDKEYQQHWVITDDSVKPFEVVREDKCIQVELPSKSPYCDLDTIFSSYKLIPLETSEEFLIGNIDRIIKCPGCYCIQDRENANVFIFEENGKFRCKLGNKGHARNEHLDAWSIAYDEKNKQIVMLDLTGRRLLSYDLMGNLKKVASLFFLYHDMAILGDDILCLTGSAYNRFSDIIDLSRLVLADKMGKPIRRGFPITEMIRDRFTYGDKMTQYKDKAYFTDLIADTVWEVSGKEMAPILNMTVNGSQRFSKDEKENITSKSYKIHTAKMPFAMSINVSPKYIALPVAIPRAGGQIALMLISRKSNRQKIVGISTNQTRLDSYLPITGPDGFADDSTLIHTFSPNFLQMGASNTPIKDHLSKEERELLKKLNPNDNPVLLLERLIDF